MQWLRDELKFVSSSAETEELALSVPDTKGVHVVPAFVGLGSPYWDPDARGSILGLTRGTSPAHIVRAALESIAYQSDDLLKSMSADCEHPVLVLKADGGATTNSFLMQFQSDISGIPVELPETAETTALGVAYLAGLYCGYWENLDEIEKNWKVLSRFEPSMPEKERIKRLDLWHKAVSATREYTK